jgi:uncharacterized membrane protein
MVQVHLLVGAESESAPPKVRHITSADLLDALAHGWDDFAAMPSHALFLCAIYPAIGIVLAGLTLGFAIVPLLFPLAAGFALIGPFAAITLYELSRRREAGASVSAGDALNALNAPSTDAIAALGMLLLGLFLMWIATAQGIYVDNFGYATPASIGAFVHDLLFTRPGWNVIVVGNGVGFLFAVVALSISVVSFPLLLDRDVGAAVALVTSVRVVLANPRTVALWGLIVTALLVIGSLPAFVGLSVILPVVGHASWHLYRKAVEPARQPRSDYASPARDGCRYAADFPAVLLPWFREDR